MPYFTILTSDGNLVEYCCGANGGSALWATGVTYTQNTAIMQNDGNFVVYSPFGPFCSTQTAGRGWYFRVQSDGNLVVYNSNGGAVWAKSWGSRCI